MFRNRLIFVNLPRDKIQVIRSRASGPGGQNINASNSRVQLRFELTSADWLSRELVDDLSKRFGKSVVVSCQDSRSSIDNEKTAFKLLQELLDDTEARLNTPAPGFETRDDYIRSIHTEKQIQSYKKRMLDSKRRAARDRNRRSLD